MTEHPALMGDMSDENGFTPKKERPDEEDCGGGGGRCWVDRDISRSRFSLASSHKKMSMIYRVSHLLMDWVGLT